jgi:hypothetical protein
VAKKQTFTFRGVDYDADDLTMGSEIQRWATVKKQIGLGMNMTYVRALKDHVCGEDHDKGEDAVLEDQLLVLGYFAARKAGDSQSTIEALAGEVTMSMLVTDEDDVDDESEESADPT